MEDIHTRPLSAIGTVTWRNWLPQALVMAYLMVATVSFVTAPLLAVNWMKLPFIGGLIEPTMMLSNIGPSGNPASWPVYNQGLTFGYQLVAMDGKPVANAADMRSALISKKAGEPVDLEIRTPQGGLQKYTIHLAEFSTGEQWAYFYIPYLVGLVYLASAYWVFAIRRRHPSGRIFAVLAISMALLIGLIFDFFTTHIFSNIWTFALAMSGGALTSLAIVFTGESKLVRRYPFTQSIGIGIACLLSLFSLFQLSRADNPFAYSVSWRIEIVFTGISLLFALVWVWTHRRRVQSPNEREQLRIILIAGVLSFSPVFGCLLAAVIFHTSFSPYFLLSLVIFPLMAAYTVQRYRMLTADYILSRALQIGLMAVLVVMGYALLAAGFGLILNQILPPGSPVVTGLVFFVVALCFIWIRDRAQTMIDAIFFRGRRAYQERLQTFSSELTRVVDLPGILQALRRHIEDSLGLTHLHIFIYDPLNDQYTASPDRNGQITSDLRFQPGSGLVTRMNEQTTSFLIGEYGELPMVLEPDRARLMLLDAQAYVPLPGRQRLTGWLALGPRVSGEAYTSPQISFLESLCDQAALAVERAQVVAKMENRVHEMNVLARVSQGVNITLTLDDILELVYAQTTSIIPAHNFHIMLYDLALDAYQFVFYLDGDDRESRMENCTIPVGQALEQEVVRQRRAILTDDFARECQRRGIATSHRILYAWIGVPLNAGAETIGALSLGNSNPGFEYTGEQQNLLQAISDQVAGAIVKARLLLETQLKARQLTTLNEMTRQLTSTLETEPLLQNILNSAVDILNCEAGSLLLVDNQTDELVFRSVVSPVAGDLLDKRMPVDKGVAGKSVKTRMPIIVNDVSKYPEWFPTPDKQTGFITQAILVIPLLVKEKVIGVIEVLNKRDGTVFSRDDQELLAAFASQAAVAIENARLYTLTDQALAARVEELSVMQRIDRELNTSLEPQRAMRITLEWAMRQSGAGAGLLGVLQENETSVIKVMAWQGYQNELESYPNGLLSALEFQLLETIKEGLPVSRSLETSEPMRGLLQNVRSQMIIPMRRETTTIGLILLESTDEHPCSEETMNFLVRLSDHASNAISNAQLYEAVQSANLAKSDFVSFVAHELKNPMTSVKGYTELISAGAVGPVNEVQANFLATIRSNIERMNTLVSDLNDMSKIEVGRLRLDFKPVRLQDVLEDVTRSIRKQVEEKTQVLNINIPDDQPPLWADRMRVVQVLVNLVSNAHKYTPAGGQLEIASEHCQNQWDPNGAPEVMHIWVKDNGIGINEEDQKKIFQKFFRSDDPKTREVTGTGLGLNITKSLVEMQGGQIWFESEFRKGTTFHFTVPLSE